MSAINEYLDSLRGKRVAVIGMGVSNMPLTRMLLRAGIRVTVRDKAPRQRLAEYAGELESLGAKLILGDDYLEKLKEDVIFRTPGMHPNTPALQAARERGSEVTSEMELFFLTCPCHLIGVTGSDGKTTTTSMIAKFLNAAGHNVYIGGNIGKPLLTDVGSMAPEDYAVLELSSFQLMTLDRSPHIAVFTNLSPNHLDYHKTMEEYTAAKEHIFLHQTSEDTVIFNLDNSLTQKMAEKAPGHTVLFSRRQRLEEGVYLRDGAIWLTNQQGRREVLPLRDIVLPGNHNIENYMAAIAAVDGIVPDQCVRQVASTFQGVEHRIEFVRAVDGVKYYNDSIGTSPTRTAACLSVFPEKVVLIAGGYDKGVPFTSLGIEIVEHVKTLILTGNTAQSIRAAVEEAPGYEPDALHMIDADDFEDAVAHARSEAEPGDIVVLSPACAAFDQFKNFMERGDTFKRLVLEFQ